MGKWRRVCCWNLFQMNWVKRHPLAIVIEKMVRFGGNVYLKLSVWGHWYDYNEYTYLLNENCIGQL